MSSRLTNAASIIYAPLCIAAVAWAWFGRASVPWTMDGAWLDAPYWVRVAASLGLGLALALGVVASTRILVARTQWAKDLHVEFRGMLGPLSSREIGFLALTSGFAEELFFRGAMQPAWGLMLSALIFGAVHTGPSKRFLPWTLWAFLMGVAFGVVFAFTGVLWGCVLAHVVINDRNLRFIQSHDPEEPSEPGELVDVFPPPTYSEGGSKPASGEGETWTATSKRG